MTLPASEETVPATDEQIAVLETWLDGRVSEEKVVVSQFALRGLIARIHSEREKAIQECTEKCREQQSAFLSPEYATGQPHSSFSERFACSECEREILSLSQVSAKT